MAGEIDWYYHTHAPSEIDCMRGAYGDTGNALCTFGDPSPDIPETLLFLFPGLGEAETWGRNGSDDFVCNWKSEYEARIGSGGVCEPTAEPRVDEDFDVGTVPLLRLLLSVDFTVRKLAFDLRRRSFRNEGAIIAWRVSRQCNLNSSATCDKLQRPLSSRVS